jgi:hypothetical protein
MSVEQTVLTPNKRGKERHEGGHHIYGRDHALDSRHAAPDGAWIVFRGASAIDMALLTELSRSPMLPKTTEDIFVRG